MVKKLSKKKLKKTSGGYIVRDEDGNYHVYDDDTGKIISGADTKKDGGSSIKSRNHNVNIK